MPKDEELFEKHFRYLTVDEIKSYRNMQRTEPKKDGQGHTMMTPDGKVKIIGQEGVSGEAYKKAIEDPTSLEGRALAVFFLSRSMQPIDQQNLVSDLDGRPLEEAKDSHTIRFDDYEIALHVSYDGNGDLSVSSGLSYDSEIYSPKEDEDNYLDNN